MKTRTVLGLGAMLLAAAMPATSLGQRSYGNRPYGRNTIGGGPFRPSNGYGNNYRNRSRGVTGPIRIGGASVYFGPGRGYGYQAPVFGYSYPYPVYGYAAPLGYGYPVYGGYRY